VDQATGADITEQVGARRPREDGEGGGERGDRGPRRDRDRHRRYPKEEPEPAHAFVSSVYSVAIVLVAYVILQQTLSLATTVSICVV
jgi:hypothetical protein